MPFSSSIHAAFLFCLTLKDPAADAPPGKFSEGLPVTVYQAGGELYSNINGIKSHNVRGRTYGALVSVGGALLLGSIVVTGTYFDLVKKSRGGADKNEVRVK